MKSRMNILELHVSIWVNPLNRKATLSASLQRGVYSMTCVIKLNIQNNTVYCLLIQIFVAQI